MAIACFIQEAVPLTPVVSLQMILSLLLPPEQLEWHRGTLTAPQMTWPDISGTK